MKEGVSVGYTVVSTVIFQIPQGTRIDVELNDGTTLDWTAFEQSLLVMDLPEHGCSAYIKSTAHIALVHFRVSWMFGELKFSFWFRIKE